MCNHVNHYRSQKEVTEHLKKHFEYTNVFASQHTLASCDKTCDRDHLIQLTLGHLFFSTHCFDNFAKRTENQSFQLLKLAFKNIKLRRSKIEGGLNKKIILPPIFLIGPYNVQGENKSLREVMKGFSQ